MHGLLPGPSDLPEGEKPLPEIPALHKHWPSGTGRAKDKEASPPQKNTDSSGEQHSLYLHPLPGPPQPEGALLHPLPLLLEPWDTKPANSPVCADWQATLNASPPSGSSPSPPPPAPQRPAWGKQAVDSKGRPGEMQRASPILSQACGQAKGQRQRSLSPSPLQKEDGPGPGLLPPPPARCLLAAQLIRESRSA